MNPEIKEYSITDMAVGQSDEIKINIDIDDITKFAELSGDYSPIHVDEDFAKKQGFDGRVVHGMLMGSYISQFIGTRLPGRYGVLQSIDIGFRKPLIAPEAICIKGEVVNISQAVGQVTLKISITNSQGHLLATAKVKCVVRS